MTKEEILQKHFNYGFTGMESNAIFKAMDEYAKRVLRLLLDQNRIGNIHLSEGVLSSKSGEIFEVPELIEMYEVYCQLKNM